MSNANMHFFDHMMGLRHRKLPKVPGDIRYLMERSRALVGDNLDVGSGEVVFFPNTLTATTYCLAQVSKAIGCIPHMTFSSHELQWNRVFETTLPSDAWKQELDYTYSNYSPKKVKKPSRQHAHVSIDYGARGFQRSLPSMDIYYSSHVSRLDGTILMTPEKYQRIKKDHPQRLVIVDGAQAVGAPQQGIQDICDIYIGVSSKFIGANPHIAFMWMSGQIREQWKLRNSKAAHLSVIDRWKPDFQWLVQQAEDIQKHWDTGRIADMRKSIQEKLSQLGCVQMPDTVDHIITYEAGHITAHNHYIDMLRRKRIIVGTTIRDRMNGNGWSFEDCYPQDSLSAWREGGEPIQRTPLVRIGLNHETTDEDVDALIKRFSVYHPDMYPAIIDANIHRACEGLRVVEEYFRFVVNDEILTDRLATLRKKIRFHKTAFSDREQLEVRDENGDARGKEMIRPRKDIHDVFLANMKRAEEAMRVLEEYTGDDAFRIFRYELYEIEKDCLLLLKKPWTLRGIYLISHDVDILRKGLELGADIIQLRCKETPKSEILQKAYQAKKLSEEFNVPLLINDYLDIAKLVDADGIHTGQDDISIADMRKLWSPEKIYGRTTHSLEQGIQARDQGANYVSVGPIWSTPTKPGREAIGFEYLSQASQLGIPFVAIGGIDHTNISELLPYQPDMVGVVRGYEGIQKMRELRGMQ